MPDNTILNPGAGGDTIATDDIGGVKHELVKVEFGSNGSATQVDAANPLPVTDAVAEAALLALVAEDFATHTAQIDNSQKTQIVDAAGNPVTVTGNKLDVNATFSGDIEIGAVEIKNSTTDDRTAVINTAPTTEFGLVTRNIPSGTQPVSAASLPLPTGAATAANQQTNAITDAQIRATPLPVSGTVSTGLTQPLTDAQLRATPVPVSGTVATGGLTDVQLRATPVPVSGTVTVTGAGDATAANQTSQITQETAINTVLGAVADAIVAAGATGSISAKLRRATQGLEDLKTLIVLAAGSAIIGKVGIDQTTPGTTNLIALSAETTKVIGTVNISASQTVQDVGNVAHDAVDSGNPVKVGQKAISFGTNPTAVASGDRTDWYANIAGIPFMIAGHPNIVCFRATYTSAQTDAAIVTISTGLKIVVTRVTVTASAANTVNVSVIIGFGTANTPTTTGVVLSHPGLAPGSGVVEGNGAGILGVGADNSDLRITSGISTGGSIDVVVSYFTIES